MALNLVPLNMENLKDVKGGMVAIMLEKALQRAAIDIESAPDITEARVVTLEIRLKPVLEQLELESVTTEFVVKGKVPSRITSASMVVRPTTNGSRQLMFNLDAQDNPQQHTLLPAGSRDVDLSIVSSDKDDPEDEDEDDLDDVEIDE